MNSKKQSRLYGVPVCTPRRAPGQRSIAIALDLYRIVSVDAPDGADVEQYRAAVIGRVQGKLYLSDADYATHMTPDDYEVIGVADHHLFPDRTTAVIETIPAESADEILEELPELFNRIYHCYPTRTVILSTHGD